MMKVGGLTCTGSKNVKHRDVDFSHRTIQEVDSVLYIERTR